MFASVLGTIAARAPKLRIVPVEAPDADEVEVTAFFEPLNFRSTATKFRGGTVTSGMGAGPCQLEGPGNRWSWRLSATN